MYPTCTMYRVQVLGGRDERQARSHEAGGEAKPAPVQHHGARRLAPPPPAGRRARPLLEARCECYSSIDVKSAHKGIK